MSGSTPRAMQEAAAAIAEKRRSGEQFDDGGQAAVEWPYASWGRRVVGATIDGLCAGVGALLIIAAGSSLGGSLGSVLILVGVGGWFLYQPVFHSTWEKTPGKAAVGIFIAREIDSCRVDFGRALGREVVKLALSLIPPVALLNVIAPAWDRKNRTWHDAIAGTIVLRDE